MSMTRARRARLTSAPIRSRSTAAVDSRSSQSAIGSSVKRERLRAKARVVRVQQPGPRHAGGFAVQVTEYLEGSDVTLAGYFLGPALRQFVGEFLERYARHPGFRLAGRATSDLADVIAAWELFREEARRLLQAGVSGLVFPGGVACISYVRDGAPVFIEAAAGNLGPDLPRVEPTTPYDLASLTKPFVATAALRLASTGKLSLGGSAFAMMNDARCGLPREVTLEALLTHRGGLEAWGGLYLDVPHEPGSGAIDWPEFEGGDTMIVAGDMKEKLVLYPIAAGSTPGARLTNWVVCAQIGDATKPPPRREDWSRPGRLEEVLPHVARFRIPFLEPRGQFFQVGPGLRQFHPVGRNVTPGHQGAVPRRDQGQLP